MALREITGNLTGVVRVSQPSWFHDFSLVGRLDIRPSAVGTILERGRANGGNLRPNTVGVFATDVVLSHMDITNAHGAIGLQLGWMNDRADRVTVEDTVIWGCGRLPPTNHDHGVYAEQVAGGHFSRVMILDCADRGFQFYPNAKDCVLEEFLISGCGEGVIFGGGDEGLGYQCPTGNVVKNGVICDSHVRYLVESDNMRADAGNIVQNVIMYGSAKGASVMPGIVGVTVVKGA